MPMEKCLEKNHMQHTLINIFSGYMKEEQIYIMYM